jgi:CCR4-NOT transcription complex subunit 9
MNKDGTFRENNDEPTTNTQEDITMIIQWVNDIKDESKRESALAELSKKRENFADLALYLWYSTGTVSSL